MRSSRLGFLAVFGGAGLALVWACGGDYYASVHFNTGQPDFGAPPRPLTITAWGQEDDRPVGYEPVQGWGEWDGEEDAYEKELAKLTAFLKDAQSAIAAGDFAKAASTYRAYQKAAAGKYPYEVPENAPPLAGIVDRIEVCAQAKALPAAKVRKYLDLRAAYDAGKTDPTKAAEQMVADKSMGFLRAHAKYLIGAVEFDKKRLPDAAKIFADGLATYPASPRADSFRVMAVRCLLGTPLNDEGWLTATPPTSQAIAKARSLMGPVLQGKTTSRFTFDLTGWSARANLLEGKSSAAVVAFLRQWGAAKNDEQKERVIASLMYTFKKLTPDQARATGDALRANPDVLPVYLEYRLFYSDANESELAGLAETAEEMLAKNPSVPVAGKAYARLAEICYFGGNFTSAIKWADASLAKGGNDVALYVRGSSRSKTGDKDAAMKDYQQLLASFPKSYLVNGTRENVALLHEAKGEFGLALDQYKALGYDSDVAYLLDARMSIPQIEAYVKAHPKDELATYALGLRYLRIDDFAKATATLRTLSSDQRLRLGQYGAKTRDQYAGFGGAGMDILRDPLDTIEQLKALKEKADASEGEARAEALYALASAYYTQRNLLLYNPSLWEGSRNVMFGWSWNTSIATGPDTRAVEEHHYEHECLYRARLLCLQIVKEFPKSPLAPKALYRAATASHRLSNFNDWWRKHEKEVDLGLEAITLMKRVSTEFPTDPLAPTAKKYAAVFEEERADGLLLGD
ncbi:MAG: tetratricopeptide repeat protein [Fimbriimonadaceae bacterium]|nr:tetratricopeptide repeat protein [Fimbriimonadaceae bacterium]